MREQKATYADPRFMKSARFIGKGVIGGIIKKREQEGER